MLIMKQQRLQRILVVLPRTNVYISITMGSLSFKIFLFSTLLAYSSIGQSDLKSLIDSYKSGKSRDIELLKSFERKKELLNDSMQYELELQLGHAYRDQSIMDSAERIYKRLAGSDKNNIDHIQIEALIHLGNIYRQRSDYSNAVTQYESAINKAIQGNHYRLEAMALNSLGGLYTETENFELGTKFCEEALEIYKVHFPEKKKDICLFMANIGNIQIALGDYDRALRFLKNAKEYNEPDENIYYNSLIYSGLGLCYLKLKDHRNALIYLNKGVKSSIDAKNVPSEIANLANLGNAYLDIKDYEQSEEALNLAYIKAIELKDKYLIKEVLSVYIPLKEAKGEYKSAFEFQKKYTELKDSLYSDDLNMQLANAQLNYDFFKKEKEILELKVKNQEQESALNKSRMWVIIGLFLLISFVALFIIFNQRNKLKSSKRIHELENKMFRLQIKPHFIFNVMSSIQNYMNKNEGKKAAVYLSKFARLIRNVLEETKKEFVTIEQELQMLQYYLDLQQLRFDPGFTYAFEIDEEIDPEVMKIPPMLIQPIVENAIEHGISGQFQEGHIVISFNVINSGIEVHVRDNGKGMEKGAELRSSYIEKESFSLKILEEQLRFYSATYKQSFSITQISNSDKSAGPTGTEVIIQMPLQELN